jgi:hypothetical protein
MILIRRNDWVLRSGIGLFKVTVPHMCLKGTKKAMETRDKITVLFQVYELGTSQMKTSHITHMLGDSLDCILKLNA